VVRVGWRLHRVRKGVRSTFSIGDDQPRAFQFAKGIHDIILAAVELRGDHGWIGEVDTLNQPSMAPGIRAGHEMVSQGMRTKRELQPLEGAEEVQTNLSEIHPAGERGRHDRCGARAWRSEVRRMTAHACTSGFSCSQASRSPRRTRRCARNPRPTPGSVIDGSANFSHPRT